VQCENKPEFEVVVVMGTKTSIRRREAAQSCSKREAAQKREQAKKLKTLHANDSERDGLTAQVRPLPKELETSWEVCNTKYWSSGRDITSKVIGGLSMPVFYLLIHTKRVVTRLTGAIGKPR